MVHATPPAAHSDRTRHFCGIAPSHGMPRTAFRERSISQPLALSHPFTDSQPNATAGNLRPLFP